jgi:hypothetical protein
MVAQTARARPIINTDRGGTSPAAEQPGLRGHQAPISGLTATLLLDLREPDYRVTQIDIATPPPR